MSGNTLNKKNKRDKFMYLLVPCLSVLVLMFDFFVKGIFPFGDDSIVRWDMGQLSVPLLTSLHDIIRSEDSLFFNWNTGGGVFILSILMLAINPLNIIYVTLCPREYIADATSLLLTAKVAFMAFTAYVFFNKVFKLSNYWKTVLSLSYAFCSYTLQYYTNIGWLDIAALFPLLMLGLFLLFKERKILPYAVVLTVILLLNLYLSYMVYLFIFMVAGLYIFLVTDKENRKTASTDLCIGSVFPLLMSAVMTLPAYINLTSSSRYGSTKSPVEVLNTVTEPTHQKMLLLMLLTALPLALVAVTMLNFKKNKKHSAFFLCALLVCCLPAIFENINLIWHMGSYYSFPMRFSYMISFLLLCCAAFAVQNYSDGIGDFLQDVKLFSLNKLGSKKALSSVLFILGTVVGLICLVPLYKECYTENNVKSNRDFILYALIFVCLTAAYFLILCTGKKRAAYIAVAVIFSAETLIYSSVAVTSGPERVKEYSLDYVKESVAVSEALNLENDGLSRLKIEGATLSSNAPLMLNYPSMSNYTHVLPSNLQDTMYDFGYSCTRTRAHTRIIDTGGTALTDALLNIKNTLSTRNMNDGLYEYSHDCSQYKLYNNRFTLPLGISLSSEALLCEDISDLGDCFDVSNKIYSELSGKSEQLISDAKAQAVINKNTADKNKTDYTYTVNITGSKTLYMCFKEDLPDDYAVRIAVNGNVLPIETLGERNVDSYPTAFNSRTLDLGTFKNETVNVKITSANLDEKNLQLKLMDIDMLTELCESTKSCITKLNRSSRSLSITAVGNGNNYLFLPVTYDKAWNCSVNSAERKIDLAVGSFMAIKLDEGENVIEMTYTPTGIKTGLTVSIISVILFAAVLIFRKLCPDLERRKLGSFVIASVKNCYAAALIAVFAFMYFLPIIITMIRLISD